MVRHRQTTVISEEKEGGLWLGFKSAARSSSSESVMTNIMMTSTNHCAEFEGYSVRDLKNEVRRVCLMLRPNFFYVTTFQVDCAL